VAVEALRRVEWGRLGVRLAVVFGSILRSPRARDVDELVFVDEGVDEDEAALRVMETWRTRLVSRLTCMWWATCLVLTVFTARGAEERGYCVQRCGWLRAARDCRGRVQRLYDFA